ncbi:MAG: FtsQ-type POTRA domain-containing protein [Clostridia bacterium]
MILCLALLLAMGILLGTRVFVVKRVVVRGNNKISSADIVKMAGLEPGTSIFWVDLQDVRAGFERMGAVTLQKVTVTWPDTVELIVQERMPSAVVDYLGTAVLVDEQGVVMERLKSLPDAGLPVVTGVNISAINVGQCVASDVAGQCEAMSTVLKALAQAKLLGDVSELNVADLDNLYLMMRGGLVVILGDKSAMQDKLLWMQSVSAQLALEGKTTGKLDVSSGKSAIYAEN